jgi:hypothetical protein
MTHPEPTAEQLQMAWRHMRGRNGCPATLEAALSSAAWHVPLVCLARQLGRRIGTSPGQGAAAQAAARLGAGNYVPPDPTAPPRPAGPTRTVPHYARPGAVPMHRPRPAGHDLKRAAANDFDD